MAQQKIKSPEKTVFCWIHHLTKLLPTTCMQPQMCKSTDIQEAVGSMSRDVRESLVARLAAKLNQRQCAIGSAKMSSISKLIQFFYIIQLCCFFLLKKITAEENYLEKLKTKKKNNLMFFWMCFPLWKASLKIQTNSGCRCFIKYSHWVLLETHHFT